MKSKLFKALALLLVLATAPQIAFCQDSKSLRIDSVQVLDKLFDSSRFNEEQQRLYWHAKVKDQNANLEGAVSYTTRNNIYLLALAEKAYSNYYISIKVDLETTLSTDEFLELEQGSSLHISGKVSEKPTIDEDCPWFEDDSISRNVDPGYLNSRDRQVCIRLQEGRLTTKLTEKTTTAETTKKIKTTKSPETSVDLSGKGGIEDGKCDPIQTIQVPGSSIWSRTDLQVPAGSRLVIEAGGLVSPNGSRWTDPNGMKSKNLWNLYDVINHCGLTGKIGKGGPVFAVGSRFDGQIGDGGELYLGINDEDPENNEGAFEVDVRICRP